MHSCEADRWKLGFVLVKLAYTDTFSGISGDMFLGALLDAGLPEKLLKKELAKLPISGYQFHSSKTKANSLSATQISITLSGDHHPHRSWSSIKKLIKQSDLQPQVIEKSLAIFRELAQAEAAVHGCSPEDVHFHEVGAVDSIIDTVGAAIGLHYFGIKQLVSSPLPMTSGWTQCDHGKLPLPAPAVCELIKDIPVYGIDLSQELVTPTGAAILKASCSSFGPFPAMTVERVGYGAGTRKIDDGRPNLLRLVIGTSACVSEAQEVEVIDTHLDDFSPEGFPYLSELLFKKGALDVALIPMQMKKGRPGFLLRVVSDQATAWELKKCILTESTAIGLRSRIEQRWTLPRQTGSVQTALGKLAVKKVTTPVGDVLYPEYEHCRRVAKEKNIPLHRVYAAISKASVNDFQPLTPDS